MNMSSITNEDIAKLAALARLEMSDTELAAMQGELVEILSYVEMLQDADTDGLEPTYQVHELSNVLRPDELPSSQIQPKELLKNLPQRSGDYIKVKRMIG